VTSLREGGPTRAFRPGDKGSRWNFGWLFYALLAVGVFMLLERSDRTQVTRIPYSELKTHILSGEVDEVQLSSDTIDARAKPVAAGEARAKSGVSVPTGARPAAKSGAKQPLHWVANRVEDPTLIPALDERKIRYSQTSSGGWLTSILLVWILPIGLLSLFWLLVLRRMKPGASLMSIGKNRSRLYAEEGTGVTFSDVAGVDEAKEELEEIVEFLKTPERFRALGGKIPKGVLLVGPPGTGKTLLARAVAGEAHAPFFSLSGSEFVEMFVGVGAARVRDLFAAAQAKAPCIIFIDELDAIGKARGLGMIGGHDEREQTLNQILTEMDGFDARRGLIVMGATNRPEILDPALLRPGRFDRIVLVDRPDLRGREDILAIHAREVKVAADVELRKVAQLTPGFAGAELANVINEAALLAARRRKAEVTMAELTEAIERVMAGLEKKNRRMNPHEKRIVAHHESGHALCAEVLPTTDPVHKISMIPRGLGALGYTLQLPLEDRYLLTERELFDRITVLLGGRAAEEEVFNELSTGAHDDLQRATDLARRMVREYGMSKAVGPVALTAPTRSAVARLIPDTLGREDPGLSERTAQTIDIEVNRIVEQAHARARHIARQHLPTLMALAAALLEREVLEGEELRQLLRQAHGEAGLESDGGTPAAKVQHDTGTSVEVAPPPRPRGEIGTQPD
jgi:cell division protease FtsH